jgi:hypothetical protein
MTYTTPRSCFICGSPWGGYGNICNACKTIKAIDSQQTSNRDNKQTNNDRIPLPLALSIIGVFLLIDYNLNFFICKFIFLLLKIGFYLMFGWWMGIDVL